jgi:hypothetical protein
LSFPPQSGQLVGSVLGVTKTSVHHAPPTAPG